MACKRASLADTCHRYLYLLCVEQHRTASDAHSLQRAVSLTVNNSCYELFTVIMLTAECTFMLAYRIAYHAAVHLKRCRRIEQQVWHAPVVCLQCSQHVPTPYWVGWIFVAGMLVGFCFITSVRQHSMASTACNDCWAPPYAYRWLESCIVA